MKKSALLIAIALLSSVSIGCTTSGGGLSSFCRTGSIFPVATSTQAQRVYIPTVGSSDFCNPCEPAACGPCEPACDPCEPVCDPCVPRTGVYGRTIIPGPVAH